MEKSGNFKNEQLKKLLQEKTYVTNISAFFTGRWATQRFYVVPALYSDHGHHLLPDDASPNQKAKRKTKNAL